MVNPFLRYTWLKKCFDTNLVNLHRQERSNDILSNFLSLNFFTLFFPTMVVSTCVLKYATQWYKKVNLVAKLIRGKSVVSALDILAFTNKKWAKILQKVVHSAFSNAQANAHLSKEECDLLKVVVEVWKGPRLGRIRFTSRSRVTHYTKYRSHVRVSLIK